MTGVHRSWLQSFVNGVYQQTPRQVEVLPKKRPLTVQADELWSFVGSKMQAVWIWLAIDKHTREIVGVAVGDRSRRTARRLWSSLPPIYRQCAVTYTDFWQAYENVFPSKRHKAVDKANGQTSLIERFNCTLRQRVSRFVRRSLSFSKSIENHIGAVWVFVHECNYQRRLKILDTTT